MTFLEFIEQEADHIHDWLHEGDMSERIWDCQPLMIMSEHKILFRGPANVDVIPHADHTAELTADVDVDGWRPHLLNATMKVHRPSGGRYSSDSWRSGVACTGLDANGRSYWWAINGFADLASPKRPDRPVKVEKETPEPADYSAPEHHKPKRRTQSDKDLSPIRRYVHNYWLLWLFGFLAIAVSVLGYISGHRSGPHP
jgi:hypothetical protein